MKLSELWSHHGHWLGLIVGIIVAIGLVSYFFWFFAVRGPSGKVEGELSAGTELVRFDTCRSRHIDPRGAHGEVFFGVDLSTTADTRWRARVLRDPVLGSVVRLTTPAHPQGTLVDPSMCKVFKVDLDTAGSMVGSVHGMRGSLSLDCPEAKGELSFEGC